MPCNYTWKTLEDSASLSLYHKKSAKKKLDDAYLKAEADFILGKINTLEHLHTSNKHHQAWKTVKELSGKSSNSSPGIKGGSSKARKESWLRHFQNLLGKKENLPDDLNLPMEEISGQLNTHY